MKKIVITSLVAASALTLAACGTSETTENVAVANDVVLNEGELAGDTVVDNTLTATDAVVENADDAAANIADATGNALANAQ